jgi:hypothetical protein
MARRILEAYETRICFLRITLDPVVFWEVRRRMESGASKVFISPA